MRKIIFSIFFLFFLLVPKESFAQSPSSAGYVIEEFKSDLRISQDTSLFIAETIEVNFLREKHGIFRTIPTTYTAKGRTIKTRLKVLSVINEQGEKYIYELSRQGGGIKIKIGDPDKTISGPVTYIIRYTISPVLQRYPEHDELYWNVTGSQWDTDIHSLTASVYSEFAPIIKVECFAGSLESTDQKCTKEIGRDFAFFESTTALGGRRDFSIVVGLDKNNDLNFPGIIQKSASFIIDNWGYLVAIFPATTIFIVWYKKGRDKRYLSENVYYKPQNVATETVSLFARRHLPLVYHPIDGLSPAEVGTISDARVNIADIVAEITELARLGFLEIRKIEKKVLFGKAGEYAFIKTEIFDDNGKRRELKDYQEYILKEIFKTINIHESVAAAEKLFEKRKAQLEEARRYLIRKEYVLLSSLTNHFYEGLPVIKEKLYKRMESEKLFAGDPEKVRKTWLGIFFLIEFFATIVLIFFVVSTFNFGPLFTSGILLLPGVFFALSMPRRTANGYSLYRQIKGLKDYLEKGKWRHEIAEKHIFIEEILPLAIALGIVDKLAKDMAELGVSPPSYFAGSSITGFSSDLVGFQMNSSRALLSIPGGSWSGASGWSGGSGFSGGGGSSGGGMGGGGGGSW